MRVGLVVGEDDVFPCTMYKAPIFGVPEVKSGVNHKLFLFIMLVGIYLPIILYMDNNHVNSGSSGGQPSSSLKCYVKMYLFTNFL